PVADAGIQSAGRAGAALRRAMRAPRPARADRPRGPSTARARRASGEDSRCRLPMARPCVAPEGVLVESSAASVEEITVLFDVGGKAQRMLAYEPLGELGSAAFQRLDDVHVLDDRARRAVLLRDRPLP